MCATCCADPPGWFLQEMDLQRAVSARLLQTQQLQASPLASKACSHVNIVPVLQDSDVDLLLDSSW
jgi:hypothetical protein